MPVACVGGARVVGAGGRTGQIAVYWTVSVPVHWRRDARAAAMFYDTTKHVAVSTIYHTGPLYLGKYTARNSAIHYRGGPQGDS